MRTLSTQVKLRRLIRSTSEAFSRLRWEPGERRMGPEEPLSVFVAESLRTVELAIAGIAQDGSDLELLRQDFERAAVPLEVFLRGLDAEPALQRSA